VQINWKRVYGTSRYVIQRADKENGTYKTVKTIKDPETTSWTDTTVENNKVYYYRIKTKNYLDGNVGYTATSEVKDTTVLVKSLKAKYLEKNSFTLAVKQSREIAITVSPSTATNQSLKWTSSDKSIATVNSNGKVTGKKVGKVTITAQTKDGSNQKISFTVKITKRKTGTSVNTSKTDIINIKKSKYTYTQMEKDIKALYKKYSEFLSYESLGKTYDNRKIYEVTLGNKNAKEHILIQSTIHGREYMNTLLVMRQIENYCMNYYTGTYNGKYYSELLDEVCIHIIPMMNPDGVTISQFGASGIKDATLRKKVESMQLRYGTYSKWRANARGVDLNRNYPLNWSSTSQTWISTANSDGTKGSSAGSEKETKILMNRIKTLKPSTVISYHSAGSVIYWNFHQTGTLQKKFKSLFNTIKAETGYSAQAVGSLRSCFGDWVAEVQKIPTLTIETGHTTSPSDCPLSISQFSALWKENKYILPALALWESKN
jgi:g-D-glutamyl-meso-diaminopimelate peptidase